MFPIFETAFLVAFSRNLIAKIDTKLLFLKLGQKSKLPLFPNRIAKK